MRYSLGIPYRTHIRNLMKSLKIIDFPNGQIHNDQATSSDRPDQANAN